MPTHARRHGYALRPPNKRPHYGYERVTYGATQDATVNLAAATAPAGADVPAAQPAEFPPASTARS